MCGRFSLGVDADRLVAEFGLAATPEEHRPRFNIAPTQPVLAVVRAPEGLRVGSLRWGLIPRGGAPRRGPLINARAETIGQRPTFSDAFRRRRCWILADGFYEWRREPGGQRVPYHIRLPDGRPFAFAGIWDRGEDAAASCAILTTEPSPAVAPIHDRMPVILRAAVRDAWLEPRTDAAALLPLLRPYEGPLEVTRVSTRVNSVANDDAACRGSIPGAQEPSRP